MNGKFQPDMFLIRNKNLYPISMVALDFFKLFSES